MYELGEDKIRLIHDYLLCEQDWNVQEAFKTFQPAEPMCLWIAALCNYHLKKIVRKAQL